MEQVAVIPPFSPRIFEFNGLYRYEDGRVTGTVDVTGSCLMIYEWSSAYKGHGHSEDALRWMRGKGFSTIIANGVGMVDGDEADPTVHYWEKMRSRKLVDTLLDDEGEEIEVGWCRGDDSPTPSP